MKPTKKANTIMKCKNYIEFIFPSCYTDGAKNEKVETDLQAKKFLLN